MDPDTILLIVLLVRHSTTRIIVLIVYVDDINIISSDSKVIVALPHFLKIEVAHYNILASIFPPTLSITK